jgi:hypothetical protein
MRRVKRFFSLSGNERRLLLRTLWRLSTTCLRLHLLPPKSWQSLLADRTSNAPCPRLRYSEGEIVWAVRAAARYVPTANCLPQAIVAKQLLDAQGYDPVVRIGVESPRPVGLKAHAWVEAGGRVILGEDEREYHTLVRH